MLVWILYGIDYIRVHKKINFFMYYSDLWSILLDNIFNGYIYHVSLEKGSFYLAFK